MYIFLIVALPLGFLLLTILLFPKKENVATRRAFLRGLIAAIPVWGLARLLGAIMPSFWGSPLLAFHEWFDRFLPYALLPALAYPIFYRYHERIPAGESQRRLTAFYAGALSLSGLAEALRVWGHPGAYPVIILPILICATALAMPCIVLSTVNEYGAGRIKIIFAGAMASLAACFVLPLFLAQLWPLAIVLTAALSAGSWLLSQSGLRSA
jgi:hypothetical protein